jgi:hypothetical protein
MVFGFFLLCIVFVLNIAADIVPIFVADDVVIMITIEKRLRGDYRRFDAYRFAVTQLWCATSRDSRFENWLDNGDDTDNNNSVVHLLAEQDCGAVYALSSYYANGNIVELHRASHTSVSLGYNS